MQPKQLQPKEYGIVYFDTSPHGAKIYVDGQLLIDPNTEESLKTPERVSLIEGRRNFTFVLEGHKDVSGYVDVLPGTTVNIFRNMEPGKSKEGWGEPEPQIWLSQQSSSNYDVNGQIDKTRGETIDMNIMQYRAPTPGSVGYVSITSYPAGATICIDGSIITDELGVPLTTPTVLALPEGYHTLVLELDGYFNGYEYVYVHPGEELSISTNLPKRALVSTIESMQESITGDVVITTYPAGATICIDENLVVDTETLEPVRTPAIISMYLGYHDLRLILEGFYDEFWAVYVLPKDTQYVHRNFNVCRECI